MTVPRWKLIGQWWLGSLLGTLIIATSSPLFVRSYLPQSLDTLRQVAVMPAGNSYRWRSEGYADTFIGPHGMPGRRDLPPAEGETLRIAIWGDSQAEGVCVADTSKLHVQIERATNRIDQSIVAFPMARSGDDAADWLPQMPRVQDAFKIDVHVLLIAELDDLVAGRDSAAVESRATNTSGIASTLPAFLIETARRLLTDIDGQPRRLRFSPGPQRNPSPVVVPRIERKDREATNDRSDRNSGIVAAERGEFAAIIKHEWDDVAAQLGQIQDAAVMIVYAPVLPNITNGIVRTVDGDDQRYLRLTRATADSGIILVDARDALRRSAAEGEWPHGFHNGRFGSGHLNETGYRVIARQIADALQDQYVEES